MSLPQDPIQAAISQNMPIIIGSISAIILGVFITMHDSKDFGKTNRPHHWQYGFPLIIGGFLALGYVLGKISEAETQLKIGGV